ncbi:MAG: hypothetical protein JWO53_183 [Chlamydiia bacterium]|nr:hypothetical protein [Chlamydiia bacterium]
MKAFYHPREYSTEESNRLRDDIKDLFENIVTKGSLKEKVAVITAGAPGSGKTTLLEKTLADETKKKGQKIAYICPDSVCLKQQKRTYVADIEKGDKSKEVRKAAYDTWRPGSNGATHLILAHLIRDEYAFYFGSTSSGPATGSSFKFLKDQGYRIRLIHLSAPDDVRWKSIQERDKTFVQTTEQDVQEKGLLLPQRIQDTFLQYADEIEFYYRNGVEERAQPAATWIRNTEKSDKLGTLQIIDNEQYKKIKIIHNTAIEQLKKPDLSWEKTVEASSSIVRVQASDSKDEKKDEFVEKKE